MYAKILQMIHVNYIVLQQGRIQHVFTVGALNRKNYII